MLFLPHLAKEGSEKQVTAIPPCPLGRQYAYAALLSVKTFMLGLVHLNYVQ